MHSYPFTLGDNYELRQLWKGRVQLEYKTLSLQIHNRKIINHYSEIVVENQGFNYQCAPLFSRQLSHTHKILRPRSPINSLKLIPNTLKSTNTKPQLIRIPNKHQYFNRLIKQQRHSSFRGELGPKNPYWFHLCKSCACKYLPLP